jgi:hypothetical protein
MIMLVTAKNEAKSKFVKRNEAKFCFFSLRSKKFEAKRSEKFEAKRSEKSEAKRSENKRKNWSLIFA